jgi:DNA-binding NarL/FixJ family response regulator
MEDMMPTSAEVSTRIVVADDAAMVRAGVRDLLASNAAWEVCGEACDGREAVEKVRNLKPDVIVLDVRIPVMNGFAAARKIREVSPATKILIFSMDDREDISDMAQQAGADAFVSKGDSPSCLLNAVKRLAEMKRSGEGS